MSMGYVEVSTQPGCNLFPPGSSIRGQVYHFSEIEWSSKEEQEQYTASLAGADVHDHQGADLCAAQQEGVEGRTAQTMKLQHGYVLKLLTPGKQPTSEGYMVGNVLASYVHLHFCSAPGFASALVQRCREVQPSLSSPQQATCTVPVHGCREPAPHSAAAAGAVGVRSGLQDAGEQGQPVDRQQQQQQPQEEGKLDQHPASRSIVSLTPAATEVVMALGLGGRLEGVTDLCDYPKHVCLGRATVAVGRVDTREHEQQ